MGPQGILEPARHPSTAAVSFCAADGHTLCLVTVDATGSELKNDATRYELTQDEITILLARIKTKEPSITIELSEEKSGFPPYQHVVPPIDRKISLQDPVGYNAHYLARISAVVSALGQKYTGLATLRFGEIGNADPLRADIEGELGKAIVVIMPVRV